MSLPARLGHPRVPFGFYGGEDKAIEEVETMVKPLRSVPAHVWEQYGGIPRFLQHDS